MKFLSIDARQRMYPIGTNRLEQGDFVIWAEDGDTAIFTYKLPGSDTAYNAHVTTDPIKQDKVGTSGTYWWWNGNRDKPTLKPSIGVPAIGSYNWHGFLTDGRFEACE